MYDVTGIALLMISLVFAVLGCLIIPWLKTKLNAEQLAYVRSAVQVAVYAAEKLYGAGNGAAKFAHAEKVLAEQYNVKLDVAKLASLIDSEIKKMEMQEIPEIVTGELMTAEEGETEEDEEEPQEREAYSLNEAAEAE